MNKKHESVIAAMATAIAWLAFVGACLVVVKQLHTLTLVSQLPPEEAAIIKFKTMLVFSVILACFSGCSAIYCTLKYRAKNNFKS